MSLICDFGNVLLCDWHKIPAASAHSLNVGLSLSITLYRFHAVAPPSSLEGMALSPIHIACNVL